MLGWQKVSVRSKWIIFGLKPDLMHNLPCQQNPVSSNDFKHFLSIYQLLYMRSPEEGEMWVVASFIAGLLGNIGPEEDVAESCSDEL